VESGARAFDASEEAAEAADEIVALDNADADAVWLEREHSDENVGNRTGSQVHSSFAVADRHASAVAYATAWSYQPGLQPLSELYIQPSACPAWRSRAAVDASSAVAEALVAKREVVVAAGYSRQKAVWVDAAAVSAAGSGVC